MRNIAVQANRIHDPIQRTEIKPHTGNPAKAEGTAERLPLRHPEQRDESNPGQNIPIDFRKGQGKQNTTRASERNRPQTLHTDRSLA